MMDFRMKVYIPARF